MAINAKLKELIMREELNKLPRGISQITKLNFVSLLRWWLEHPEVLPPKLRDGFIVQYQTVHHDDYGFPNEWQVRVDFGDAGVLSFQFVPGALWTRATLGARFGKKSKSLSAPRNPVPVNEGISQADFLAMIADIAAENHFMPQVFPDEIEVVFQRKDGKWQIYFDGGGEFGEDGIEQFGPKDWRQADVVIETEKPEKPEKHKKSGKAKVDDTL
jgi:hypothetical protein